MAKNWYVVRVQSGKEDPVRESLERRIRLEGLDEVICRVLVPSERISEIRGGQKRVRERRIYPGYVMVEIETGEGTEIPEAAIEPPAKRNGDPIDEETKQRILGAFGQFSITQEHLENNIGCTIDQWTTEDRKALLQGYNDLRAKKAKPEDWM